VRSTPQHRKEEGRILFLFTMITRRELTITETFWRYLILFKRTPTQTRRPTITIKS